MKIFKNILKAVAFLVLFLIVFSAVSTPLVISGDDDEYQWMAGIYEEREDSLDAVYLSSSNCYAFWNPVIAWERSGIAVFPFVCSSQPLIAAEYLVREARKTQPDALYIINTNTLGDDLVAGKDAPPDNLAQGEETGSNFTDVVMHRVLDYLPFSFNKLNLTHYLCDAAELSFSERLEYYFPIIRYHDKWESLTELNFDRELNTVKGADTRYWYFSHIYDVTDAYYVPEESLPISELMTDSLTSLCDYLEEEAVNVLFVTVPRAEKNEGEPERISTVNDMLRERGFEVLDLRDKKDEIGLDTTVDYYNVNHTNIHGSMKFTYYLSDYLIENYGFEDKRGDDDYAEWDQAVTDYDVYLKNRILPIEKFWGKRNYEIYAPWIQSMTPNGDTAIDIVWTSAYGADGYDVYRKINDVEWQWLADVEETTFTDTDAAASAKYVYTIAPYELVDGEKYYGRLRYWGQAVEK